MSQMQDQAIGAVFKLLADPTADIGRVGNALSRFLYFGELEPEVTSFKGDSANGITYQVTATKTHFNPEVVGDFAGKLSLILGSDLSEKGKLGLSMALLGAAVSYLNGGNVKNFLSFNGRESTLDGLLNSVGQHFDFPKLEVANNSASGNFFINDSAGRENTAAAELVKLSALGMVIHTNENAMTELVQNLREPN
jgi:hypothetical protein